MNKLDLYDIQKIEKARKLINEVYEYNYVPSSSLSKKLNTLLKKIDYILKTEQSE